MQKFGEKLTKNFGIAFLVPNNSAMLLLVLLLVRELDLRHHDPYWNIVQGSGHKVLAIAVSVFVFERGFDIAIDLI